MGLECKLMCMLKTLRWFKLIRIPTTVSSTNGVLLWDIEPCNLIWGGRLWNCTSVISGRHYWITVATTFGRRPALCRQGLGVEALLYEYKHYLWPLSHGWVCLYSPSKRLTISCETSETATAACDCADLFICFHHFINAQDLCYYWHFLWIVCFK